MIEYKIVDILEGFQNSYNDPQYQLWGITEDNQRMLLGIFRTKKQVENCIKGLKNG